MGFGSAQRLAKRFDLGRNSMYNLVFSARGAWKVFVISGKLQEIEETSLNSE